VFQTLSPDRLTDFFTLQVKAATQRTAPPAKNAN